MDEDRKMLWKVSLVLSLFIVKFVVSAPPNLPDSLTELIAGMSQVYNKGFNNNSATCTC